MIKLDLTKLRSINIELIRQEEIDQLIDVVETSAKYMKARRIVYGDKSNFKDFDCMNSLEAELFKLVENVEI